MEYLGPKGQKKEMISMKIQKRIGSFFFIISMFFLFLIAVASIVANRTLPNQYYVLKGSALVASPNGLLQTEKLGKVEEVNLTTQNGGTYEAEIQLFGFIPLKTVTVNVVEEEKVTPSGAAFGIKMLTDGVIVVGIAEIQTASGYENPGEAADIQKGDIITHVNGQAIASNEEFASYLTSSGGNALTLTVSRETDIFETTLLPVKALSDNVYKAGLWVRDSTAGIGTITFCDAQTGKFGGLGHGVCDVDTSHLMPLASGSVVEVTIMGCIRGVKGTAGELQGYFTTGIPIGELYGNDETGVYGRLYSASDHSEEISIAFKQEVVTGEAQILTTIDETGPHYYTVAIESINYSESQRTKNMVISVVDEELLQATGGIVQGMSGSPILQNGKLVGAVTHVFLNDPTRGYGIFAENMMQEFFGERAKDTSLSPAA